MLRTITPLLFIAAFSLSAHAAPPRPDFPHTQLSIGMWRIDAEVASNEAAREYGLMYRETMPGNTGMVFIFETAQQYCMWMKNTLLPLSVAFMDEQARIINIAEMLPQTEISHCASKPARFALEMNKGWFKSKNIKPGTRIEGLDRYGASTK